MKTKHFAYWLGSVSILLRDSTLITIHKLYETSQDCFCLAKKVKIVFGKNARAKKKKKDFDVSGY